MMKREKSCGVLVLRQQEEELYVVLLRHRFGGHWSFPKGHVEAGESERQTALREVREETGLTGIKLMDGFRESVEYSPKPGVKNRWYISWGPPSRKNWCGRRKRSARLCGRR